MGLDYAVLVITILCVILLRLILIINVGFMLEVDIYAAELTYLCSIRVMMTFLFVMLFNNSIRRYLIHSVLCVLVLYMYVVRVVLSYEAQGDYQTCKVWTVGMMGGNDVCWNGGMSWNNEV